ncbi:hypothetical protein TSPI_07870 [Trichinella spiralis]|uniref:Uncharacterized protein n=1 Tax=Trichinella spiralis TaxID=6334 RepID=A0ABR3KX22_TRISP
MRYASVRIGQLDRRTDRHKWTRHNEDKDPGCCQHRWSNICPVRGSCDAFKRPPCLSALFCQLPGQRAPATLRGRLIRLSSRLLHARAITSSQQPFLYYYSSHLSRHYVH